MLSYNQKRREKAKCPELGAFTNCTVNTISDFYWLVNGMVRLKSTYAFIDTDLLTYNKCYLYSNI